MPFRLAGQSYKVLATVVDSSTTDEVSGVRVKLASMIGEGPTFGAVSGREGEVTISGVSSGRYVLSVSSSGFAPYKMEIRIPGTETGDSIVLRIVLIPLVKDVAEVVVSGTRSERSIDDVPVRVEMVSQEWRLKGGQSIEVFVLPYRDGVVSPPK